MNLEHCQGKGGYQNGDGGGEFLPPLSSIPSLHQVQHQEAKVVCDRRVTGVSLLWWEGDDHPYFYYWKVGSFGTSCMCWQQEKEVTSPPPSSRSPASANLWLLLLWSQDRKEEGAVGGGSVLPRVMPLAPCSAVFDRSTWRLRDWWVCHPWLAHQELLKSGLFPSATGRTLE